MNSFTIEKSPKRESPNKGNNFENQYDHLARNPMGDSKIHNEIKAEMGLECMAKYPNLTPTLNLLRNERTIDPIQENLNQRDRYVKCGTFGRKIDENVARGQAALVMAGYDLGEYGYKGVDGINGQNTKKALTEFQKAVGLKPTGEFDRETMNALELVAKYKLTKEEIETIGKKVIRRQELEKPAAPKREPVKPLSPEELTPEARKRLAERDEKVKQINIRKTGGNYQYAQVEVSLEMLGYKLDKPLDGKPDPKMIESLKQFQKDTGLPVTGKLDPDTYYMLERKKAEGWKRPEVGIKENKIINHTDNLGVLSAKYESKGDPGIIANTKGDPGGKSYGAYQFASNEGTVNNFLVWLKNENPEYWYKLNEAKQIDKGTLGVNFDKAWKNLAINDRQGFLKLQHNFIKHKYFDEAAKELKDKYGFDVSSKSIALQNVLWSTAVQHGVSGAVKIFRNAGLNLNEEQLIIAVYNERGKIVDYDEMRKIKKGTINIINGNDNKNYMKIAKKYQINGKVMRYFSGCSAEVQVGVYERFRKEKEDALKIYRENRGV